MVKLTVMFRRAPQLTQEEFLAHWREVHVPLVARIPGIVRYTISPTSRSPDEERPVYDGMASLYFASYEALEAALASDETAATAIDGRNFIERGTIKRLVSEEHEVIDGRVVDRAQEA
jgi:uncharacterized protein (TIGR02118 family)